MAVEASGALRDVMLESEVSSAPVWSEVAAPGVPYVNCLDAAALPSLPPHAATARHKRETIPVRFAMQDS
jgi:hypothetical protein